MRPKTGTLETCSTIVQTITPMPYATCMNTPLSGTPLVSRLLKSWQRATPGPGQARTAKNPTPGFHDLEIAMKTTLFALFFLCATAALGQSAASLSNEPQVIQIPSHNLHASQIPMQQERTLLITSSTVYARGERPLWEFASPAPVETPLGDLARLLRNQHAIARKATKVVEQ